MSEIKRRRLVDGGHIIDQDVGISPSLGVTVESGDFRLQVSINSDGRVEVYCPTHSILVQPRVSNAIEILPVERR